jgi:hypothetical protein
MNHAIILILIALVTGAASGCPTCVGRADKNRPLFFSKQSYRKSEEPSPAQKKYHKLKKAQIKNKNHIK